MYNLYETIYSLCEKKGISGYRLCKDLGIQPSIISDLKSGRKKGLSADYANRIADYFNVSVGFLLGGVEEEKKKPADQKADGLESEFMKLFSVLSPDQQEFVLNAMRGMQPGR